jgi:pyruvate,water dikinase
VSEAVRAGAGTVASDPGPREALVSLATLRRGDAPRAGSKAANLGDLLAAGFPVPDGFVVLPDAPGGAPLIAALESTLAALSDSLSPVRGAEGGGEGGPALAVRSSATAEDLPDASFAGLYDTVLGVRGVEAIADAVARCRDSLSGKRVASYRSSMSGGRMAVLVQRMVEGDAAGVAFTANPVTGDRDEVVVSAVRGRGDALVSGQQSGERWTVGGAGARLEGQAGPGAVLAPEQAQAIAALARRVEDHFGAPQDIEWALAGGRVHLLQARPMTALPAPVRWQAPLPGGWMRNFRIGEWLPEPVTPLFESWFLERCEASFAEAQRAACGWAPPAPRHVVVNGWYFHSPLGSGTARLFLTGLLRRPRFSLAFMRAPTHPAAADRLIAGPHARRWQEVLLPRYRALVAGGAEVLASGTRPALVELVNEIADFAGEALWSVAMVGGFAWKVEGALARFCRRLAGPLPAGHQVLLSGLAPPQQPPPHAVQSLDWWRPTVGELVRPESGGRPSRGDVSLGGAPAADLGDRHQRLVRQRGEAEAACRAALTGRARRRFDELLALAQRYGVLREEQMAVLTLGWPTLRAAVGRLGAELARGGTLGTAEDVFFVTRQELAAALAGQSPSLATAVAGRRREWEAHRRLTPPLVVGRLSPVLGRMLAGTVEAMRAGAPSTRPVLLRAMPASPGRATGRVRVIREPAGWDRLQAGEVLVTQTTTPAWTPLFARAAAVVTDGGCIAAHASLVAREYGIPAVVGAGDATARLHDGQLVTVDGSAGVVEPVG